MSQQHHDLGYLDYNAPTNRSPGSSRQPYGAPGFAAGMSLPRQAQRPFDGPLGSSALYDRSVSGYAPSRGIDTMSPAAPSYMLDNGQSWNYNSSGAATVNGVPGRGKSLGRRGVLPQVSDVREKTFTICH